MTIKNIKRLFYKWFYKRFVVLESYIDDDYLEDRLKQYHVRYFRYKLNKTEYRYIVCSKDLERVRKEN